MESPLHQRHILLVDDDERVLVSPSADLEAMEYRVVTASSGEAGNSSILANAAADLIGRSTMAPVF
jgi:CheY-like chemotaxis protein